MGSMLPDFFLRVNTKKSGRIEMNIFGHRSIAAPVSAGSVGGVPYVLHRRGIGESP